MSRSGTQYTTVAKVLHWLIAILIIVQIPLGIRMLAIESPLEKFWWFQLHKSLGLTVLLLMVARLLWRMAHPAPALPADMPWYERIGARLSHIGFYLLLFAIPLTGWAMVSASRFPIPTLLYQTIPWPHLPWLAELPLERKIPIEDTLKGIHAVFAYGLAALLSLHIIAALRHGLVLRDGVFSRMAFRLGRAPSSTNVILAVVVGVAAASLDVTSAKANEWGVKPEKSRIAFEATGGGTTAKGSFGRYKAEIRFDPEAPQMATIRVMLDMKSAATGTKDVDSTIQSADFFDSAKFPTATFVANGAKFVSEGKYELDGQLTMKGVTKPVKVPFAIQIKSGEATATGELKLNRLDFGVGPASIAGVPVDKDVKLSIELFALRLDN